MPLGGYRGDWLQLSQVDRVQHRCNASGLLQLAALATLNKLQCAQNNQRCIYKLATLTYKVQLTVTPAYLHSLLVSRAPDRSLRSGSAKRLIVPQTRTVIGSRAFSIAAPTVWNALPDNVVNAASLFDCC